MLALKQVGLAAEPLERQEWGRATDRSGGGPQRGADHGEASKALAWGKNLRGCQKR